jgi:hypothetical protein
MACGAFPKQKVAIEVDGLAFHSDGEVFHNEYRQPDGGEDGENVADDVIPVVRGGDRHDAGRHHRRENIRLHGVMSTSADMRCSNVIAALPPDDGSPYAGYCASIPLA